MPAVSYNDPNQSHFTSRHYWEVGALEPNGTTGWLGRLLDRIGTARQPDPGHLARRAALAGARAGKRSRRDGRRRDATTSGRPGVWGDVEDLMYDAHGAPRRGRTPAKRDASIAQAGARRRAVDAGAQASLLPFGDGGVTTPGALPGRGRRAFPQYMAALAAMLAAGLPIRCAALNAPGSYDTHEEQPGDLQSGLKLTSDTLLAFQRDLEARGLAGPSRDAPLVGVRPPARRRTAPTAPTTGPAASASSSEARVNGAMLGEFPGLDTARRRRQPPLHRSTSARSTARSSSSGSVRTPRRSSRAPRRSRARG